MIYWLSIKKSKSLNVFIKKNNPNMVSQNYTASKTNIFYNLFYLSLFSPILLGRHGENSKWMIKHAIIIMFSPHFQGTRDLYKCLYKRIKKNPKTKPNNRHFLCCYSKLLKH